MSKHLFVDKAYERPWIEKTYRLLKEFNHLSESRDVMVDAGAHIGMVACAMIRHNYFRSAIAVEAEPGNFELLKQNISQNQFEQKIFPWHSALSDVNGSLHLAKSPENSGAGYALPRDKHENLPPYVEVPAITLDHLLEREFPEFAERVGLIWMDVEGHESKLLQGAKIVGQRSIPIVAELNSEAVEIGGSSREELLDVWRSYFTHFCVLDDRGSIAYPISDAERIYKLQEQTPKTCVNLLLFKAT